MSKRLPRTSAESQHYIDTGHLPNDAFAVNRRCLGSGRVAAALFQGQVDATKRFPCPICGKAVKTVGRGSHRVYAYHHDPRRQNNG